jgi:hypothetical protein
LISDIFENCLYAQGADLKPTQNKGWIQSPDGKRWESPTSADAEIEFEFTGKILFVGFDFDKEAESLVTFSIDGGAAQPLKANGNRVPLAENLAPGKHRLLITFSGGKAPEGSVAKARVWGVGAAGVTK